MSNIRLYTKKYEPFEAIQFTEENFEEICELIKGMPRGDEYFQVFYGKNNDKFTPVLIEHSNIHTRVNVLRPGDWLACSHDDGYSAKYWYAQKYGFKEEYFEIGSDDCKCKKKTFWQGIKKIFKTWSKT